MHADRYRRRLDGHISQGRLDAALAVLAAWQAGAPGDAEPELLRARVDLLGGRYVAARTRFLDAVRERVVAPTLAMEVVEGLRRFVAHDALAQWAREYPRRAALAPADQARIAAALSGIGAAALAHSWIDAAVAVAPDDGVCRVNRALIHHYAGDFAAAEADLRHVLGTPQESAMGYWLQARLRRQQPENNHLAALRSRLDIAGLPAHDREFLYFALFKELDDLGDVDAAWHTLSHAHALARQRAAYDRSRHERVFAALKLPLGTPASASGDHAFTPIFIVGLHRTGSTLLESILATQENVCAYGESLRLTAALSQAADWDTAGVVDEGLAQRLASLEHGRVADAYLAEGRYLIGSAPYVTDKLPGNFQLIGAIRHAMPHAKVVHVGREPMDVCFANLREKFSDGINHADAMQDMAHYHGLYRDLMAHWHRAYPGFVLDVAYEDLVSDSLAVARRVFDFCGLPWDAGALDPARRAGRSITTLSAVPARGVVSSASVGRWKPYARWLEPLRHALDAAENPN